MFLFVFSLLAVIISSSLSSFPFEKEQCVSFQSEVCADFTYTHAYLGPGVDPKDVEERLKGYRLLIESECHPCLLEFLCFSYYPFCQPEYDIVVRPCRSLCVDVKDKCLGLIEAAGFTWPQELNCSFYPESDCPVPCEEAKECRPCNLQDGKGVICSKEFSWYAHIRVKEQLEFHHTIAYKAELLSLYRPRLYRGGKAGGDAKEIIIITESTQNCTCVELKEGHEYFVGGIYYASLSLHQHSLYILPNNAIIREWYGGRPLRRKIKRCLVNIDV